MEGDARSGIGLLYFLLPPPFRSTAPYGYPPMGDDSYDMDGFRFWKQGYWKELLRDKPYHISALYVIDLARFRRIAAGDRLRGHYQSLSADPNSLANLDQDLPNSRELTSLTGREELRECGFPFYVSDYHCICLFQSLFFHLSSSSLSSHLHAGQDMAVSKGSPTSKPDATSPY